MSVKVGLIAICKNNQDIIVRMLESAIKHVDLVHLTDTGSTDNTVQVATDFLTKSGKPFTIATHIETPFHFANARNVSVAAVDDQCDFILSLDTDDVLPPDWKWPDFQADVYSQKYPYMVFRLWRTKMGIEYERRIHETISWKPGTKLQHTDATIIHHQSHRTDPERNIKLLKIDDATHRTLFYIANEYVDLKQFEAAVAYYQHYINRCKFEPHWEEELMCSIWRCARWLERLGRVDESTALSHYGLKINPKYAELWRQLGWNNRNDPKLLAEYTQKGNACDFFPHLFAEEWAYRPVGYNILRPGANGDLVMLSAVTTQLQNCVLYTKCPEVGAKLDGVVEVRDSDDWEKRDRRYKDWAPNYPREGLQEHIIETLCKAAGLPVGPMRLKE